MQKIWPVELAINYHEQLRVFFNTWSNEMQEFENILL